MGFIMDPTIAKDGDLWIELIYLVLQELRSLSLSSDGPIVHGLAQAIVHGEVLIIRF